MQGQYLLVTSRWIRMTMPCTRRGSPFRTQRRSSPPSALGPTPYTAPPDAPSNASVGLMPPLPMFGAMPNDFGLPGYPA